MIQSKEYYYRDLGLDFSIAELGEKSENAEMAVRH